MVDVELNSTTIRLIERFISNNTADWFYVKKKYNLKLAVESGIEIVAC